ncbi:carboxyl transferase domain-containing protein [Streptomyces sp. NPDC002888]|uniref:carboxyl transferase domain-containing protein n=1 Tax=Streptomyces sp. NPDC002888 TaxID=3364668 RepID=UPI0036C03BEE
MSVRLTAREAIALVSDHFEELPHPERQSGPDGPLGWQGYDASRARAAERTGEKESIVCGTASVEGTRAVLIAFEFGFLGGSLGERTGDRLESAYTHARAHRLPVVPLVATGGSRMQEGMLALTQLQRVARQSALTREAGLPQIAVLRDPTTGGGWATLGAGADVILALPTAQVGFAGSRVRPPGADPTAYTAESQVAAGSADAVVRPEELRELLGRWLRLLTGGVTGRTPPTGTSTPGTRLAGASGPGTPLPGAPTPGTPRAGTPTPGTPTPGTPLTDTPLTDTSTPDTPLPDASTPGTPRPGTPAASSSPTAASGRPDTTDRPATTGRPTTADQDATGEDAVAAAPPPSVQDATTTPPMPEPAPLPPALGVADLPLSGWDAVQRARSPQRPRAESYLDAYFTHRVPLSGDRCGGADPEGMLCGFGEHAGRTVAYAAQTGAATRPAGYRTAARLIRLADRLGIPVLTLVDTPGAANDAEAERQGAGAAIADLFGAVAAARTPVTTLVIGEGGSGGALALAAPGNTWATPDSYFSVIAPELAAAILKRTPEEVEQTADQLRVRPQDLVELGVVRGIAPIAGGAPLPPPA